VQAVHAVVGDADHEPLRLVFGRKRNLLLLAVTVVFPVVIGIAPRVAAPHPRGGGNGPGAAFFNELAGNGVFLAFIALSTLLILVLPVVVAVVAGDSVAGEAGYGTLRHLLAVPAALGAIGLAVSTMTEHAIGAIAAIVILVVTSEVVDSVPQLAAIGPYLPTHWWLSFDSILRAPVGTSTLLEGLLSFGIYLVLFGSFAWARFTSADVTS
jgi:ABC-type transport system involved in multi-copper enzyme maturation permease subunit